MVKKDPIAVFGGYLDNSLKNLKSDLESIRRLSTNLLDMKANKYPATFMTDNELMKVKTIGKEGLEVYNKGISYLDYANTDLKKQALTIGMVSGKNAGFFFYLDGLSPVQNACNKWRKKYDASRISVGKKIEEREKKGTKPISPKRK